MFEEAIPWHTHDDPPALILEAVGAITLLAGSMEEGLFVLIAHFLALSEDVVTSIFHSMNNRARSELLGGLIGAASHTEDEKEALLHALKCWDICTENRNVLAHSTYWERREDKLLFVKNPSAVGGQGWFYAVTVPELSALAEAAKETHHFIAALTVKTDPNPDREGREMPWPDKPLPPRKLSLFQLPADRLDELLPPRSFPQ